MIKRSINYTNMAGEPATAVFYFNIGPKEVMAIGLGDKIRRFQALDEERVRIAERKYENELEQVDVQTNFLLRWTDLVEEFIEASYGVKDGEDYFEKSPEILKKFKSHVAYGDFLWNLANEPEEFGEFIQGIVPADMWKAGQDEQARRAALLRAPQDHQQAQRPAPAPSARETFAERQKEASFIRPQSEIGTVKTEAQIRAEVRAEFEAERAKAAENTVSQPRHIESYGDSDSSQQ